MGAQSYPGAVWAPVTRFPPNWQFTSQTLDCLLSHGFFFSQSRPGAPRATSDPRFGFSTVDPPTSQRENLEKKKVESRVQKSEIPKGADFFQEQIQRIGTRPAGCATSVCSGDARTRKSDPLETA